MAQPSDGRLLRVDGSGPATAAVRVAGLSKHYDQVRALEDVTLDVARSRLLVLLGPSGSGKSTLIRCLAGIERPTGGTIAVGGTLVAGPRRHVAPEHRDLAMVFQDFALWPHMTAAENVMFPLRRRGVRSPDARGRAHAMLDRVGLPRHAGRYPHELSGGEQQRVALARALVANPTLLLFDEPLSSLDANLRERLRIEIGTLVREHGATAVYITHDQREAFALGDEVGILQSGRLVQHGTPEQIYRTPATPFVAQFTGLAGRLPGRVRRIAVDRTGLVQVAIPTTNPTVHAELLGTPMVDLAPGDPVTVMLRPTAVRPCNPHVRAATLRARVRDGAYHGRGYDLVLEVGDGLEFTGVFARRRFTRGETIGVYIDPAAALVFPADPAINVAPVSVDALPGAPDDHSGDPPRPLTRFTHQ